jgi:hypothetical protein
MANTTFSGPVNSTNGFVGEVTGNVTGAVLATTPVNATDATLTVTKASHGGRYVTLNRAAGVTVTLPEASGTGTAYSFVVGTTVSSNTTVIKVANASDTMTGTAYVVSDNSAAVLGFRTAASDDTITFNGTTTGGLKGDVVHVVDVALNLFSVTVLTAATGTEATPFSATV